MAHSRPQNPKLAAALILFACAFIAGTMLLSKMLGQGLFGTDFHPMQISFGRFLFAFVALAAFFLIRRPTFTKPDLRRHIARSALGWAGVSLMFAAAALIALPDATAISFLNPVFGMVFAVLLLGERVGPVRIGAAVLAVVGAIVLLRPSTDSFQLGGLLALTAAVFLGLELILIKQLSGREPLFQILILNNLIGLGIASTAASFVWQTPNSTEWAALAGIGLMMMVAQICYVNAMARADASFVAPISYATLIFAALYDFWVFDAVPDWISYVGAALILTGALLLAWREGRVKSSTNG